MSSNSNLHKRDQYQELKNEMPLNQSVSTQVPQTMPSIEQKVDEMFSNLQNLHDATINSMQEAVGKLSSSIVTKVDLKELVEQINVKEEGSSLPPSNVEMDVVKESASYAKQLINLLEQASLNYVSERQAKDKLHEELVATRQQLAKEISNNKSLESEKRQMEFKLNEQLTALQKQLTKADEDAEYIKKEKKQVEDELREELAKMKIKLDESRERNKELEKESNWNKALLKKEREFSNRQPDSEV